MIPITMAVCNRPRITEIAIRELAKRTTSKFALYIHDDGSDYDVWIDSFLSAPFCVFGHSHTDVTNGVHYARNKLLEAVASYDLYVSTDNDIVPQSPVDGVDWLQLLTELMERHPDYAAIALRPHIMIGDNVNKMFADADEVVERGHVGAVLRMMRTQAVRDVGGWSAKIKPGRNDEEKWICGKLRNTGWKVGYARDVRAIHLFGDPEQGEDPWGYDGALKPEDHGHRDIWPPADRFQWDRHGIDWESCR